MHKILHTRHKRKIAYKHHKGKSKIGFLFFPGFYSDMMGSKAIEIYNNFSAILNESLANEHPTKNGARRLRFPNRCE